MPDLVCLAFLLGVLGFSRLHLDPSSSHRGGVCNNRHDRLALCWRHFVFHAFRHTSSRACHVTTQVLRTETDHLLLCRRRASADAEVAATTRVPLLRYMLKSRSSRCHSSAPVNSANGPLAKMFCLLPFTAAAVSFILPLVAAQYGSSNHTVDLGYAKYQGVLNQR